MKSRSPEERLRLYRESLRYAWGFTDYNDWPVKLNSIFHLFLPEFGQELLEDLSVLEEQYGLSIEELARLFGNPARIYRIIDSTVYSMRRSGYSLRDQRNVVLKLLSMVKALKYGSEFNEDGRNIILGPEQVNALAVEKVDRARCCSKDAATVHRLCGLLWAYTETIFFRAHDVTKELHGPYSVSEGEAVLVIKEYLNLCPRGIWPGAALPQFNEVVVSLKYDKRVRLSIDALNHVYAEGPALIENLIGLDVRLDGREVSMPEIESVVEEVGTAIRGMAQHVDALSWNEKVVKYAEIFWFRKAPVSIARGRDWHLPPDVRARCARGKENPRRVSKLPPEQVRRLAMLTI